MAFQPLVSIIVPAHNYGHLIHQTIESVLGQTYPHLECVIVDDGSTDDTRRVVMQFAQQDARVKYLYQGNQGVSAARNYGIQNSSGAYIQFLDADDLIEPRKLELQVKYLTSHPEVDIVYGSARFFSTEKMEDRLFSMYDENAQSSYIPKLSASDNNALRVLVGSMMPINTTLSRRQVIEVNVPFDVSLNSVEDSDFWIRCAANGAKFQYYDPDETLALIRSHEISASKNRRNQLGKIIEMRKKVARTITDQKALKTNRKVWSADEGYLGIEEVTAGNVMRGLRHILRASVLSSGANAKAKWLACAMAAPFIGEQHLKKLPAIPISRWRKILFARA